MKYYLILLTVFLCQNIPFQEVNLEGKYTIHFEKGYKNQDGTIYFNKGSYKRKLLNGKEVSGSIENQKFRVVLKDENSPLEMIIVKSRIDNDTIPFRTMDSSDKSKLTGDIVLHEGKLIKL